MAKSLEESRKRANYAKGRSGCLICKERHLKCDETLPSCHRCQRSGRVCKWSGGKPSKDDPTLRPSNTSPAANTRAITTNTVDRRPCTATTPPISPSDSENRHSTELCVESSAANTGQRYTSAEPRATPAINTPDPGDDPTKDSVCVEIFEEQEKNMLHPGRNQRPGVQTGDDGPLTSMVSMEVSKLPADSFQHPAQGGDLADDANKPRRSSIIANQEGSKNVPTRKRVADTEATSAKRTRRYENEDNDWTIASKSTGKHTQAAEGVEYSASTSGHASQADSEIFQASGQASSEYGETIQKARMAMMAVDTQPTDSRNRWSGSSQSNIPPDSKMESNYSSPYPIADRDSGRTQIAPRTNQHHVIKCPGNLASPRHAKLSAQAANSANHSQPTPPSVGLSQHSPESSNPDIPADSEQGRLSSVALPVPINTTQYSTKLWNAQSTLAADGDYRSTAQDAQAPSVDHDSPPRDGTDCLKTSDRDQLTNMLGCFDSRPYRSMAQASLHMRNQTSMQDLDAKPPNPQMTSPANTTAGNYGAESLHARHQPGSLDSATGPGALHNSSSSAALFATDLRDESQVRPYTRPSQRNESRWEDASDSSVNLNQRLPLGYGGDTGKSVPQAHERRLRPHDANTHASYGFPQSAYQSPALKFGIDNKIESNLSTAEMQPLLEIFSKNSQVLLRPKRSPSRDKVYPVGVIIWQGSADFYKWYLTETGTAQIAILKFDLFDASGKFEKVFFVPGGDLNAFQMLKQYIWDSFWTTSQLNGAPAPFKVLVRAASHIGSEAFPHTSIGPWGNGMTTALPAERPTTSKLGNVGTVGDSRIPAALIPQGNNRSTPYYNEAATCQIPFPAPARITNSVTAPQMHFPPVPMNTNIRAARQPDRPEFPPHGTASMDTAIIPTTRQHQPGGAPQLCDPSSQRTAICPLPAPDIVVRIQTDRTGKLSHIYDKSVLSPRITAMDFFGWFAGQTDRGGDEGPPSLRFTLKDAIPIPRSRTITRTNEDHFDLMRNDIKAQFGKTRKHMPNLKEFTILVTDPEWVLEEDW